MTPNLALRWLTIPGTLLLLVDGLLVAFVVQRISALIGSHPSHPVLRWLQRGIITVLVIIASAWLLSAFSQLDSRGFLGLHLVAGVLLALRRGTGFQPVLSRTRAGSPCHPSLSSVLFLGVKSRSEHAAASGRHPAKRDRVPFGRRILLPLAGWIFVIVLAYLFLIAVGTFAMNWDSQTYRLSRVGYWLQERRIAMNFANEPRLFFMPINAELFMLWLTCFFPAGYPLANLGQFLGGCLTLLSAWEMGRLAGLSRERRLLALFLVLGLPVVCLEFATSQSDLFTGGLLNAGLVFFWRSLRNTSRSDIVFSGLALGLALGAKSTVVYWIPGLELWAALLLLKYRPGFPRALSVVAIAGVITLLVGGWKYADNMVRFGNPFAPAAEIARVHQQGGAGGVAALSFVARSHLWQLAQADSNPAFLAPLLGRTSQSLADRIGPSAPDPQLLASFANVRAAYVGDPVFEDIASFGLLVPLLAILGLVFDAFRSLRGIDPGAPLRLAMAAAAAAFLVVFLHEMNLNAWNYRYFVMFAPFVAILAAAAWPVRTAAKTALVAVFLVMMLQAFTVVDLQNRNVLGGWRSWFGRPAGTSLFESLAGQLAGSDPAAHRVAVAVGVNEWLSPYFRLPGKRKISFVSLDTLAQRYKSPSDFLDRAGFDALVTDPGVFATGSWPGIAANTNGLTGPFARVLYTRIK